MDRKAQGLSINIIIIVAIALIVLVVLIAVFTGRLGNFGQDVDSSRSCQVTCSALGQDFTDTADCSGAGEKFVPGSFTDAADGCCCTG
tara:strand:+ start:1790 stop:2053 length:264 start_codon:yes stop_codon:yes gene_type:complete